MTIKIELSPEDERRLREEAQRRGQQPHEYAEDLLLQGLRPSRSLAEILAPFRAQVAESGITEEDFADLVEEAREEAYLERTQRVAGQ